MILAPVFCAEWRAGWSGSTKVCAFDKAHRVCNEMGIAEKKIHPAAIKLLMGRKWPGNIREFRNVMERLVILGGKEIAEEDVKQFGL